MAKSAMRIPASGPLPMRASCSYFPGISRVLGPMSSHISSLLVSSLISIALCYKSCGKFGLESESLATAPMYRSHDANQPRSAVTSCGRGPLSCEHACVSPSPAIRSRLSLAFRRPRLSDSSCCWRRRARLPLLPSRLTSALTYAVSQRA